MQTMKRVISFLLVLVLVLGMCPQPGYAVEGTEPVSAVAEETVPETTVPEATVTVEEISLEAAGAASEEEIESIEDEERICTVTYYSEDGSEVLYQDETPVFDFVVVPDCARRTGYTFLGWAGAPYSDVVSAYPEDELTLDFDWELYAAWEPAQELPLDTAIRTEVKYPYGYVVYSFTPETTGGYRFWADPFTEIEIAQEDDSVIGHTYGDGWEENADIGILLDAGETYYITVIDMEGYGYGWWTDFTAQALDEIIVSYDPNGGEGAPEKQTKVLNDVLLLSSVIPTRDGHVFLGWSEDPDAEEVDYEPGNLYWDDRSVTLYAVWDPLEVTVHFDGNGGTGAPQDQSVQSGETVDLADEVPIYVGHTFWGWTTDPNSTAGETYYPGDSYTADSDVTLYAVWDTAMSLFVNNYEEHYVADVVFEGQQVWFSVTPDQTGTYGFESNLTDTAMDSYAELYDAAGNYLIGSDDDGEDYNFRFEYPLTAGNTYYFMMGLMSGTGTIPFTTTREVVIEGTETYTITYDANGGFNAPEAEIKQQFEPYTLAEEIPERFGMNFAGWSDEPDGYLDWIPGGTYDWDQDITLYAVWEAAQTLPSDITSESFNANIPFAGANQWFTFTPNQTAEYRIQSSEYQDTRMWLYGADGTLLAEADDNGDDSNFLLDYTFESGKTYYIVVGYYYQDTGYLQFALTQLGENGYIVTYSPNGGDFAPTSQTKLPGENLELAGDIPWLDGAVFMGWATTPDAIQPEYYSCDIYTEDADLTLYAVWNPIHEIPSDVTECRFIDEIRYGYDRLYYTFVPEKTAWYTFESFGDHDTMIDILDDLQCWYAGDDDSGESSNFYVECLMEAGRKYYIQPRMFSNGVGTMDFTVTRRDFEGEIYTITYDANGGRSAPDPQQKMEDMDEVLDTWLPYRAGYTLLGWAADANAVEAEYLPGDVYTDNASVTLYAVWQEPTVIPSDTTDGTFTAQGRFYGNWHAFTFTPEESGLYQFRGYCESDSRMELFNAGRGYLTSGYENGEDGNFLVEYPLTAGKTYYLDISGGSNEYDFDFSIVRIGDAEEDQTCILSYITNCNEDNSYETVEPGTTVQVQGYVPIRWGYTFRGWEDEKTGEVYYPWDEVTICQDMILQAQWEPAVVIPGDVGFGSFAAWINYSDGDEMFVFTPEESGAYCFESKSEDDPYLQIYNQNGECLVEADDSDNSLNFCLEMEMTAGRTYHIQVSLMGSATGTVPFTVTRAGVRAEGRIQVSNSIGFQGDSVDVTISLAENPGIASMQLNVAYDDDKLTLVSVSDSGNLGTAVHSNNLSLNPCVLTWANDLVTENFTFNGDIVTLTFAVAEDAEIGETPITVTYDHDNYDIIDADGAPVAFEVVNGSVNITDVIIGDVNRDGRVNTQDRLILTRYLAKWTGYDEIDETAADVNGDGRVNTQDRLILTRFLAKWSGYETLPYSA